IRSKSRRASWRTNALPCCNHSSPQGARPGPRENTLASPRCKDMRQQLYTPTPRARCQRHTRHPTTLLSKRSVCYDYQSRGEVSERLKELASKASVGEILPWVQIPPSPPT